MDAHAIHLRAFQSLDVTPQARELVALGEVRVHPRGDMRGMSDRGGDLDNLRRPHPPLVWPRAPRRTSRNAGQLPERQL
jgi:hypothetical protein